MIASSRPQRRIPMLARIPRAVRNRAALPSILVLLLLFASGTARGEGWTVSVVAFGQATGTTTVNPMWQQAASSKYGSQVVPVTLTGSSGAASLSTSAGTGPQDNNPSATGTTSGSLVTVTLSWTPKNGDWNLDPAPSLVCIGLLRRVEAKGYVYANAIAARSSLTANSNASVSLAGFTATIANLSVTATAPGYPPDNETQSDDVPLSDSFPLADYVPVVNGVATKTYNLSWSMGCGCDDPVQSPSSSSATADISWSLSVIPGYVDLARGNGVVGGHHFSSHSSVRIGLDGNVQANIGDPTFTRWLPLTYSPVVSSQPVRNMAGSLPAPWGNVSCLYSINLHRENNVDVNGGFLRYLIPSGVPAKTISNTVTSNPGYVITDANGNRLTYDNNFVRNTDIFSDLVGIAGGGYELRNAGPAGAIASRGRYTYRFEPLPSTDPNNFQPARLIAVIDDMGNQQSLTWGSGLTVTDSSSGRQRTFVAGTGGYYTTVNAPGSPGTKTTVTYDGSGHATQLQVFLSTGGLAVRNDLFGYSGDTINSIQQLGLTSTFTYLTTGAPDALGSLIPRIATGVYGSSTDTTSSDTGGSVQGTYSFTYGTQTNPYGGVDARKNTVTDPRGNIWTTSWNDVNGAIHTLTSTGPTYTGAAGANQTSVNYSPDINHPTSIAATDALNQIWQANVDGNGNPTQFVDPLSNIVNLGWSADGKYLTSVQDPTGLSWLFGYTGNRVTSVTDPGNSTRLTAIYNAFGQPTSVTVPAAVAASGTAETSALTYDAITGDLTKILSPGSDAFTIGTYDSLGDPVSASAYPDTGNPATSTSPLTASMNCDAAQNPIQAILPNGAAVNLTWTNGVATLANSNAPSWAGGGILLQNSRSVDSRGRPYALSDLVGSRIQLRYDNNDNVKQIWDGRGNKTLVNYGPANEPTGITWPGGQGQSCTYDSAGRVASATDERGAVANYGYDNANRLTGITFPAYSTQNLTFGYDNAGRITSISRANGDGATINYDSIRKRLTSVVTTTSGYTYTISYGYYADGKLQTMTSPVGTTTYLYNANGQLSSISDPFSQNTGFGFDHAGRMTGQTSTTRQAKTIQTTWTYGISGQTGDTSAAPAYLRTITQVANGTTVRQYTLIHSYLGQLLSRTATGAGGFSETDSFGYDNRSRLASESNQVISGGVTYSSSGSYSYDLADNVQGGTGGWTYNSNNQVTSAPAYGGLAGVSGLGYDAAGNLTSGAGMTLSYDALGQMTQATGTPSGTASYTYDVLGRRASKTVSGVTTNFLYDGDSPVAESSGGVNTHSYTWGPTGLVSDAAYAAGAWTNHFALNDDAGDTRVTIAENGAVSEKRAFSAYQARYWANNGGSWSTPVNRGTYNDAETGLGYSGGSSYYSAGMGRYSTPTGPGFSGGNPYPYTPSVVDDDGLNLGSNTNAFSFGGRRAGLHRFANQMESTLNTLADFNPLVQAFEVGTGRDAANHKVSAGRRVFILGTMAMGSIGHVAQVGGEAEAGGEVAFGFTKNLYNFKKVVPHATNYMDWGLDPYHAQFSEALLEKMNGASAIHFDLSNMRFLNTGPDSVLGGAVRYPLGSTNWELRTIWDNPALRGKTTFYRDGTDIGIDKILKLH